ncbi:MAG: hypothetical protein U0P46_14430 [Holophagaceae bacterium]
MAEMLGYGPRTWPELLEFMAEADAAQVKRSSLLTAGTGRAPSRTSASWAAGRDITIVTAFAMGEAA